ncbi:MAG: glycine cleavage system protein GcvH [Verrucomicrobiota bacterium]
MSYPDQFYYTESHEWVSLEGDIATIGITDHAQNELSDIVFVECPEVGKSVTAKEATAVVESVKAASDIYAPVAGEISAANDELENDPALVNTSPHEQGWIFKLKVTDPAEVESLMDHSAYEKFLKN